MSKVQLVLRLTRHGGSGGVEERILPQTDDILLTHIVQPDHDGVTFHTASERDGIDGIIASFKSLIPLLLFESRVRHVTILSPPSQQSPQPPQTIALHPSRPGSRYYIHMRPGDVLHFADQAFNIDVLLPHQTESMAKPSLAASDNVQVKSSLPDVDADVALKAEQSSDEQTDNELDDLSTVLSVHTPAVGAEDNTPATSRLPTAGTVKDAPLRPLTPDTNRLFSTAPHAPVSEPEAGVDNSNDVMDAPDLNPAEVEATDEPQLLPDPESPSERAKESQGSKSRHSDRSESQKAESQVRSARGLLNSMEEVATSSPRSKSGLKTYSRLANPRRRSPVIPGTVAKDRQQTMPRQLAPISLGRSSDDEQEANGEEIVASASPLPAVAVDQHDDQSTGNTSEPLDEADVGRTSPFNERHAATEAATRSVRSSEKRKVSFEEEEEDTVPTKSKRSRTQAAPPEEVAIGPADEAQVLPSLGKLKSISRRPRARHSELAKLPEDTAQLLSSSTEARGSSRGTQTEENSDVVIVSHPTATAKRFIKPKSSPQVRPTPPQRASNTPRSSGGSTALTGKAPKVLLSNSPVAEDPELKKWLRTQGATVIEKVPTEATHFICVVGMGQLHTTVKLLRALAMGKTVVTDNWVLESHEATRLLELDGYAHAEVAETAQIDRGRLFKGKTLFFTPKLKKDYAAGWADVVDLAEQVGASQVETGTARKAGAMKRHADVVLFGSDKGDAEAKRLLQDYGRTLYRKDLLTASILRGAVDLNADEFKLSIGRDQPAERARKR